MCGFLGQFNTPNLPKSDFKRMLALGVHRGPDQTGYWAGERVQLGFNRLSILDLSEAGHQPMASPNKRFVVVFNGEIYNFEEIRKKLPSYNYHGHSDTEVITHAIEVWGVRKTIELLDGMFALAIYDTHATELTLVRDFAGIKPLFFGLIDGQVVFSSQYDQVSGHPLFFNASINPEVLKLYLSQHFIPAPFGLKKGTFQVRPGEMVHFSKHGEMKKERYWELPDVLSKDLIRDEQEAIKIYDKALEQCISDQLIADVPLGAFLSGGVDSPLVVAKIKQYKAELTVFSIGSDSKIHDESERAKMFAEALNVKQYSWKLAANEMLSFWDEATKSLHEPLADFSILPTYLVSYLAKKHVTVALSGDGGDELFFGYERFWSIAKNIAFQKYPGIARKTIYGADKYLTGNRYTNSLLTIAHQSKAHESLHCRFSKNWQDRVIPDLRDVGLPEEWDVYNYENSSDLSTLMARMRKAEFYGMMQKTLRKVDLASMQNSLEVRVPFLQKASIETALQIDPLLTMQFGQQKALLKKMLQNSVPDVIDDGVKRGFTIPLGNWLREGLEEKIKDRLSGLPSKINGFSAAGIDDLLSDHNKGKDLKWPIFTLYAL